MTTSVADRFKALRGDMRGLSTEQHQQAFDAIDALAHELPLIGAMATRNFNDIVALPDLECEVAGVQQRPDPVVDQVAEPEGVAA